jgi:prepilin-type processing-associated H-X9-DG protein
MHRPPTIPGSPRYSRGAFTLLEILVTAGIVLVLAALLVPSAKSMIDKGSQSKCTANLKQLYLAVRHYSQDNNDRIIYARGKRTGSTSPDWAPELAFNGYLGADSVPLGSIGSIEQVGKFAVFRCPSALLNRKGQPSAAKEYTYGFNGLLTDAESPRGTKTFAQLSMPSRTLMISEGSGTTGWYLNGAKLPNAEHADYANLLFCDGHVESRKPKDLPPATGTEGEIFWRGVEN